MGAGLAVAAVLAAGPARADGAAATPCQDEPLHCLQAQGAFDRTETLPIEWKFDTGWVPASSPLQVHLSGGVDAHTRVALAGTVVASWSREDQPDPGVLQLHVPGTPGGGLLGYAYGIDLHADGNIDLKSELNWSWTGKLPFISKLDLDLKSEGTFDAWGYAPGVKLSDSTQKIPVVKLNILKLLGVYVPFVGAGFELEMALDVSATWINERMVIERAGLPVDGGAIGAASGKSFMKGLGGAFAELDVHPEGKMVYTGTLHLIPTLYLQALKKWKMPLIDVPVSFPITSKPWTFPAARVHLPLPDMSVADESIDFGRVKVGADAARSVALHNGGEAAIAGAMSVEGVAFQLDGAAVALAPGASGAAKLVFAPKTAGPFNATLRIVTNDPDQPLRTVSLHGDAEVAGGNGSAGPGEVAEAAISGVSASEAAGCACSLAGTGPRESAAGWLAMAGLVLVVMRRNRRTIRS